MPKPRLSDEERKERLKLKARRWRANNPGYKSSQWAEAKRKYRESGKAKDRMRRHKMLLVDLFGGACQCCNEVYHYSAMDFHHVDKGSKERQVQPDRSWQTLVREASKCILLCANCHRVYHYYGRNLDCNTIQSFPHTEKLAKIYSGELHGPELEALLEAEIKLKEIK